MYQSVPPAPSKKPFPSSTGTLPALTAAIQNRFDPQQMADAEGKKQPVTHALCSSGLHLEYKRHVYLITFTAAAASADAAFGRVKRQKTAGGSSVDKAPPHRASSDSAKAICRNLNPEWGSKEL